MFTCLRVFEELSTLLQHRIRIVWWLIDVTHWFFPTHDGHCTRQSYLPYAEEVMRSLYNVKTSFG